MSLVQGYYRVVTPYINSLDIHPFDPHTSSDREGEGEGREARKEG